MERRANAEGSRSAALQSGPTTAQWSQKDMLLCRYLESLGYRVARRGLRPGTEKIDYPDVAVARVPQGRAGAIVNAASCSTARGSARAWRPTRCAGSAPRSATIVRTVDQLQGTQQRERAEPGRTASWTGPARADGKSMAGNAFRGRPTYCAHKQDNGTRARRLF